MQRHYSVAQRYALGAVARGGFFHSNEIHSGSAVGQVEVVPVVADLDLVESRVTQIRAGEDSLLKGSSDFAYVARPGRIDGNDWTVGSKRCCLSDHVHVLNTRPLP